MGKSRGAVIDLWQVQLEKRWRELLSRDSEYIPRSKFEEYKHNQENKVVNLADRRHEGKE